MTTCIICHVPTRQTALCDEHYGLDALQRLVQAGALTEFPGAPKAPNYQEIQTLAAYQAKVSAKTAFYDTVYARLEAHRAVLDARQGIRPATTGQSDCPCCGGHEYARVVSYPGGWLCDRCAERLASVRRRAHHMGDRISDWRGHVSFLSHVGHMTLAPLVLDTWSDQLAAIMRRDGHWLDDGPTESGCAA